VDIGGYWNQKEQRLCRIRDGGSYIAYEIYYDIKKIDLDSLDEDIRPYFKELAVYLPEATESLKNIKDVFDSGVSVAAIGSGILKAENPREEWEELQKYIIM